MDDFLAALQWPAMAITLVSAWLVASQSKRKRSWGFWLFIVSNLMWVVWGWHDGAMALIAMQVGLFALNVRGAMKNNTPAQTDNPTQNQSGQPTDSQKSNPTEAPHAST